MSECDAVPSVTVQELRERAARFQVHLAAEGLAGAVLVQNVDRYYFSGTMQAGYVVVPVEGDPLVLVRRDPDRAGRESPLPVQALGSLRDLAGRIRASLGELPSPVGVEEDVLPATQRNRLEALLAGVELRDASRAIQRTRAVKSPWEVERIREAARAVAEAVETVPRYLFPGVSELELSARVECELRLRGHGGLVRMRGFNQELFFGHVMAGAAAAQPSFLDAPTGGLGAAPALAQGASRRPIRPGDPVVVDLVGNSAGYLSDQTRIFSLGEPREPFGRAFEAALAVERAVVEAARPGVPASRLYEAALEAAAASPFAGHFMGEVQRVSFVGHGIGLEVDELPFLARGFDAPLEEGMVFAVEPKFVFAGRGVVGIEDTFRVGADGAERLTPSPQVLTVV
ncbi:MAG: Xaa-Pro peptidase family protein [Deferrisomatales bacterium]|nr:Xaa-Pro peptidase family protein [Deferrisomatales bacterium]